MPGVPIPPIIAETVARNFAQRAAPVENKETTTAVDGVLRVTWRRQIFDVARKRAKFVDGVVATFGPSVLTAEELELDYEAKIGRARGKVRLVDPEGELEASDLIFNWQERTGEATDAFVRVADVRGQVGKITIRPDRWILERVYATASPRKTPDIAFRSKYVEVEPGKRGRARNPELLLFGKKLLSLPTSSFTLDRRVEGLRIPTVSFRQKEGFGMNWSSGVLLTDQSALNASLSAFPKNLPNYFVNYAISSTPPSASTGFITPRSELEERFSNGFLERIDVRAPEAEDADIRARRRTIAVQSSWNFATAGRFKDVTGITKPIELIGEMSGESNGWGYFSQARVHQIRATSKDAFQLRTMASTTLQGPKLQLARGLDLRYRVDLMGITSARATSSFARAALSASASPVRHWRLTAGYARGRDFGKTSYSFDALGRTHTAQIRVDGKIGNIDVGLMYKYDLGRKNWYDTEWMTSIPMGSFDFFMQARLFPRTSTFGLRLRAQQTLGRLADRNQVRMSQLQKPKK